MKHFNKVTLAAIIICAFHYACPTEPMRSIKTLEDLQSFMGKIVLFDSDKYYFSGGTEAYQLNNTFRIAFITTTLQSFMNAERGITMRRVIKKGAHGSMCALVPSTITTTNLKMRTASTEECKIVHDAIIHGQAELEYGILHEEAFKQALIQ